MNPLENTVRGFQEFVAHVPEFLQPFIVTLAGAVPFIEGEGASPIGVMGGINPIVAGVAAAVGNFLAVLVVVLVSSRARTAVVARRAARVERVPATATRGSAGTGAMTATLPDRGPEPHDGDVESDQVPARSESKGRRRFKTWLNRFGVPGASLLGPLAIPTHITSAMLIAAGTSRSWVLLWQAVAIVVWTTLTTTAMWLAVTAVMSA